MNAGPYFSCADHLLRRRDEARAGVVGLVADRAIELGGMADGLVDREPEVGRVEDQVVAARPRRVFAASFSAASDAHRSALPGMFERLDVLPALAARRELLARSVWKSPLPTAVAENDGPTRMNVCVTFGALGGERASSSRAAAAALEFTKRTPCTLSAASLAASSSATFSSSGTSSGSRVTGVIHVPLHRRHRRQLDAALLHGARGRDSTAASRAAVLRAGLRHRARRGEAPAAVDERAHAEAVRLAVADAGDLALARVDGLPAIAADADVGVGGARVARGVERLVGELDDEGIGRRRGQRLRGRVETGSGTPPACRRRRRVLMKSRRVGDMGRVYG